MSANFSRWDYIKSFLFPVTLESKNSPINTGLEVILTNGHLILDCAGANYSFGGLHTVFQQAFKKIRLDKFPAENVLVLGLGAGSVPTIIYDELHMNVTIEAVEKDEVVIDIGKRYFNIDRFSNLKIICADAFDYIKNSNQSFDVIVIDIYEELTIPEKFETTEFFQQVHNHLKANGIMVYNKVIGTPQMYGQYLSIMEISKSIFSNIQSVKASRFNQVIVGTK